MTPSNRCESCGMPLTVDTDHALGDGSIPYCRHCTDAEGGLQPFEERLAAMTEFAMRRDRLDRGAAEARTREYMRDMPAWRDHPALRA